MVLTLDVQQDGSGWLISAETMPSGHSREAQVKVLNPGSEPRTWEEAVRLAVNDFLAWSIDPFA